MQARVWPSHSSRRDRISQDFVEQRLGGQFAVVAVGELNRAARVVVSRSIGRSGSRPRKAKAAIQAITPL